MSHPKAQRIALKTPSSNFVSNIKPPKAETVALCADPSVQCSHPPSSLQHALLTHAFRYPPVARPPNLVLLVRSLSVFSNRTCTAPLCPFRAAACKDVYSSLSFALGSAPCSKSKCNIASRPLRAASCSAVHPYLSCILTSAICLTSSCAAATGPSRAALQSAVCLHSHSEH